jgi:hypothetical protein
MVNDIVLANSGNPIKNGSLIASCLLTGERATLDTYTNNTPVIDDIEAKYDNRFYNGIFVNFVEGSIGGGDSNP